MHMGTDWEITHISSETYSSLFGNRPSKDPSWAASLDWRTVVMPCMVQNSSFGLPIDELYISDHFRDVQWMRDRFWVYRTRFPAVLISDDEEAVYRFLGIDYRYGIYLNGSEVLQQEGMFSIVEIPLAGMKELNELVVVIHPFIEARDLPENTKARCTAGYGWDFAPAILTAGIWNDAEIIVRKRLRVTNASVQTTIANIERADVVVHIKISEPLENGTATAVLAGVKRSCPIVDTDCVELTMNISSPSLWWPNGSGEPNLVDLEITLDVEGRTTEIFRQKVGLREIGRIPCEGQGVEDIALQLVINKQKIFLKGVNWVPLDLCLASITTERYWSLLSEFRAAGVNFIRVWGGGITEKEGFYDLCDQMGLMVMQEFPLACQNIARSMRYLHLLEQEVSSIITRLKSHPSVVIWSGGNEHYHYWDNVDSGSETMESIKSRVLEQFRIHEEDAKNSAWRAGCDKYDEPALALMGHLCSLHDGTRPYQITSGMEGEGEVHGIWTWNPRIGDHRYRDYDSLYSYWLSAEAHLFSECSVSSIACLDTIKTVLDDDHPTLPSADHPDWRLHKAFFSAWDDLQDLWLDIPSTEKLFGPVRELGTLVLVNQWMQGEGARFLIEEIRRKMPRTCGIVWWGVNEPWPNLAGNALIDYYGRRKIGWFFLKNAYKTTILSLRYDHCIARRVKPQLWISHDGASDFKGRYVVTMENLKTGRIDSYGGVITCGKYSSAFIKQLDPIRMHPNTIVRAECTLFSDEDDSALHENLYLFGSDEDEHPFASIIDLVKERWG
jgi:beta-mannosidase